MKVSGVIGNCIYMKTPGFICLGVEFRNERTQEAEIYIRDSIALRFQPFRRMYENGSKIALNSTCSKGLHKRSLP